MISDDVPFNPNQAPNPYAFQGPSMYGGLDPMSRFGRPPMGGGKGGYRPPMYGGGFGRPPMYGPPQMGPIKGGPRPPMYGGGFGGGFGGPFGGGFGGNFPSPYASQQYRQDVARSLARSGIPPGFVPTELQTGNSRSYINPQTGETMSIPVDLSDRQRRLASGEIIPTGADGPYIAALPGNPLQGGGMMGTTNPDGTLSVGAGQLPAGDVIQGNPLQGGGMMATTNPDGTTTIGAGQFPSDQLIGSGIAGVNLAGGNQQPTNPYSMGYGMGFQQQPNQQPMGGGKGGSGGGKGGAR